MTNTLRIGGVPEHFNLPWKLALADDAFAPLQLEYTDYPGGTGAMVAALDNGRIDAALLLTEGAVVDILGGADNRLVSVYVNSPLVWGIHVAAGGEITDVSKIRGKRFAISRFGSGSHLIAAVDAAERGFDATQIEFVVVDSLDGARAALANGDADVFLWEKHMTQPLVDNGEFRRVGERIVPWPAFVVSVRRAYLAQHAPAVRRALAVVADYARQLKQGEDSARRISETYNIALHDAEAWLAGVDWCDDNDFPAAALERVVTALSSQNIIASAALDRDKLWYDL